MKKDPSIFVIAVCYLFAFCALTQLGGRKGIRPVKKWGDGWGGHWLVRMNQPDGRCVCLC